MAQQRFSRLLHAEGASEDDPDGSTTTAARSSEPATLTNKGVLSEPLLLRLGSANPLSPEDKLALRRLCGNVRGFPRRRDILVPRQASGCVHILISGVAARYIVLPSGSRRITGLVLPGDILDELGGRHVTPDHNIVALSECMLALPPKGDFEKTVISSRSLVEAFSEAAIVEAGIVRQWLAGAGRRSAIEMVAHLLCELHVRMRLVGVARGYSLPLPMTQEDIGDATGLTAVHVNRTMRVLRENMLVDRVGSDLRLLNVPELRSLSGFTPHYLRQSENLSRP